MRVCARVCMSCRCVRVCVPVCVCVCVYVSCVCCQPLQPPAYPQPLRTQRSPTVPHATPRHATPHTHTHTHALVCCVAPPYTRARARSQTGALDAVGTMVRGEGAGSLYKGLVPTLVGVAPYAAINFATYDLLKKALYHGER